MKRQPGKKLKNSMSTKEKMKVVVVGGGGVFCSDVSNLSDQWLFSWLFTLLRTPLFSRVEGFRFRISAPPHQHQHIEPS